MITASELASMRADIADVACNLPCVIERKTTVKDTLGTESDVWVTISPDDLKCGMSEPSGGQLTNYAYVIGSLAAWQVKLPYGTDVIHQDRLLVTGEFAQQTLTCQVVLEPRSYATLLTILASEVK